MFSKLQTYSPIEWIFFFPINLYKGTFKHISDLHGSGLCTYGNSGLGCLSLNKPILYSSLLLQML